MLAVGDAAESLDCTPERVIELLKDGVLPGLKIGRGWVIPRDAFFAEVNLLAKARMVERAREHGVTTGAVGHVVRFPAAAEKKPGRPRLR